MHDAPSAISKLISLIRGFKGSSRGLVGRIQGHERIRPCEGSGGLREACSTHQEQRRDNGVDQQVGAASGVKEPLRDKRRGGVKDNRKETRRLSPLSLASEAPDEQTDPMRLD